MLPKVPALKIQNAMLLFATVIYSEYSGDISLVSPTGPTYTCLISSWNNSHPKGWLHHCWRHGRRRSWTIIPSTETSTSPKCFEN